MARKKPDYSQQNIASLQAFCDKNDLVLTWKNMSAGHAVVSSPDVEIYVWVQRMKCEIRKRNGVQLAQGEWVQGNYIFNEREFQKYLGTPKGNGTKKKKRKDKNRYYHPHHENGVTVMRIPANATHNQKQEALVKLRNYAMQFNRPYAHRYGED